ncbi:MAG: NusG domain II-containing protein [Clostridiales bacterium]|jgi:hypothetical protein|nr:NusG domain II-containing protein [Clostridiales bacterium]
MKFARKSDIIIIAIVAAISVLTWFIYGNLYGHSGKYAEIYYRSELVKTVDLTTGEEGRFSLEQAPNVVFQLYKDGSIAFVQSDCPDKICVKSGRLHRVGEYAACIPNRIYIKILSEEKAGPEQPDIIIG